MQMAIKHTRREAITGMGMGIIASMFPGWIFAREKIQLSNRIVTYLNPESILVNRGVSSKIEKALFNASGEWKIPYRMWMAIGGEQDENKGSSTIGFLILEKKIDKSRPGRVNIAVRQQIMQQGGRPQFQDFQYTEAQIVCQDNDIATPLEWQIENSIWRGNAKLDYCSFTEKGQIEISKNDVRVKLKVNDVSRPDLIFEPGTNLTSDFTLIAALPKLLEAKSRTMLSQFVLLEKLRLHKDNQLLFRNQEYDYTSDNFGPLHKVEHRGDGIQPFDYWLDENGCPLFICTLHNAYIYDLKAEEKVAQICATGKRRQFED